MKQESMSTAGSMRDIKTANSGSPARGRGGGAAPEAGVKHTDGEHGCMQ